MSKFDEFIDEFVFMAKNAAGAASKKTNEVFEISKLKYQMKQVEWDIEKAYAKLGAIVYESKRSNDDFADAILLATSEIDDLKLKLDSFEESLQSQRRVKKCEHCDKSNDASAFYCAYCGSPLEAAAVPEEEAPEADESGEAEDEDHDL